MIQKRGMRTAILGITMFMVGSTVLAQFDPAAVMQQMQKSVNQMQGSQPSSVPTPVQPEAPKATTTTQVAPAIATAKATPSAAGGDPETCLKNSNAPTTANPFTLKGVRIGISEKELMCLIPNLDPNEATNSMYRKYGLRALYCDKDCNFQLGGRDSLKIEAYLVKGKLISFTFKYGTGTSADGPFATDAINLFKQKYGMPVGEVKGPMPEAKWRNVDSNLTTTYELFQISSLSASKQIDDMNSQIKDDAERAKRDEASKRAQGLQNKF